MLTDLTRCLTGLLTAAGHPVYHPDCVPAGTPRPFVTLEITPPLSLHEVGRVTLTGWPEEPCSMAGRLALAESLLTLVPAAGRKLPLESGLALIERKGMQWVEFHGALGVRLDFSLRVMGGAARA